VVGQVSARAVEIEVSKGTERSLAAAVTVAAVLAAGAWLQARSAVGQARSQVLTGELRPLATLLREDRAILTKLQSPVFVEPGSGILEAYLAKIRRDGLPKHVDMKELLDQLAENNTAIVTLLKAYAPQAKTSGFTAEGDKFRNYASAWRDRWNSVMELFMAGGNYAAAEVSFPDGLPAAIDAEIAAAN